MTTTLLIPVDETPEGERALPVAAALAARSGGRIDPVTVGAPHGDPSGADAYHRRLLAGVPGAVRGRGRVVPTDDGVAETLVATSVADEATLCMAATGRGPIGELLAGSIVAEVVQLSPRPVILVGPNAVADGGTALLTGRVVAALDGSPRDEAVLATLTAWPFGSDPEVHLLHVNVDDALPGAREKADQLVERARTMLVEHDVACSTQVLEGPDPAPVLLDALTPGDLLVVGSHRHGPLGRLSFAATAMWLVHRAPCPMVVVPTPPGP